MGETVRNFFKELSEDIKLMRTFIPVLVVIIGGSQWLFTNKVNESIDAKLNPMIQSVNKLSQDYQDTIIQDIAKQDWKIKHEEEDLKEIDLENIIKNWSKISNPDEMTTIQYNRVKQYYETKF